MFSKLTGRSTAASRLWNTLAFRLTAGYAVVGLCLVFLAIVSLYLVLVGELDSSTDLFLADKVHVLSTMLLEKPNDREALEEEVELEPAARRFEPFYVRLLDAQRHLQLMTPGMAEQLDLQALDRQALDRGRLQRAGSSEHAMRMTGKSGKAFRVTSVRLPLGRSPGPFDTVQIAIDISQKDALLARYRLWFWAILLTSFLIFPLVGYQIARHGIRPVEEMATTARLISSSNLKERIHPEGYPTELASLAGTFNQMLDRLEESFTRISRFSADIAHDLRTPVHNIRGEAEVVLQRQRTAGEYREVIESNLEEAVRLSDLIGDLLFLGRAESPLSRLHRERVDVVDLLDGVRDYYEASAAEGAISLTTLATAGPVVAELDRTLLQRAVGNLVSNAIAYTPRGGSIVLRSIAGPATVRIEVADTGVGIPAEALPRVFDRFFRVDSSRSQNSGGTGLGLAIVKSIAVLHGGQVDILSQPGKGTRVLLTVPISSAG